MKKQLLVGLFAIAALATAGTVQALGLHGLGTTTVHLTGAEATKRQKNLVEKAKEFKKHNEALTRSVQEMTAARDQAVNALADYHFKKAKVDLVLGNMYANKAQRKNVYQRLHKYMSNPGYTM